MPVRDALPQRSTSRQKLAGQQSSKAPYWNTDSETKHATEQASVSKKESSI